MNAEEFYRKHRHEHCYGLKGMSGIAYLDIPDLMEAYLAHQTELDQQSFIERETKRLLNKHRPLHCSKCGREVKTPEYWDETAVVCIPCHFGHTAEVVAEVAQCSCDQATCPSCGPRIAKRVVSEAAKTLGSSKSGMYP